MTQILIGWMDKATVDQVYEPERALVSSKSVESFPASWNAPELIPWLLATAEAAGGRQVGLVSTPDGVVDLLFTVGKVVPLRLLRCYWVATGHQLEAVPLQEFGRGQSAGGWEGAFLSLGPVPDSVREWASASVVQLWEGPVAEAGWRDLGKKLAGLLDSRC